MSDINSLVLLAAEFSKDELASIGIATELGDEFSEALKLEMDAQRAKATADAAKAAVEIIKINTIARTNLVLRIRELRRQIAQTQSELGELEMAQAYGVETRNFIPLAARLAKNGYHQYNTYFPEDITAVVPKGWKPKKNVAPVKPTSK